MIDKNIELVPRETIWPIIKEAREMSIFSNEGRVFLDVAASVAGCSVEGIGNLIDKDGRAVTDGHPDYEWIINMAKRQAVVESSIGRDLLE